MHKLATGLAAAVALASAAWLTPAIAQPQAQAQAGQPDFGQMLVAGLEATEGCAGVETASLGSGKAVIIAWFENKAAAERWYYSETHKRVMGMVGGDMERKPMQHVADDIPIMVMAAITPSRGGPGINGSPIPISQISIEMYTPLPGGAMVNGRLTPMSIDIPHMRGLGDED